MSIRWMQQKSIYPVKSELGDTTKEVVMEAMGKLKGEKAGGKSGILILDMFHITCMWMEQRVPDDWIHTMCQFLGKATSHSDSWHGISLLDVVRKFFTKVIPMRLQRVTALKHSTTLYLLFVNLHLTLCQGKLCGMC